MEVISGIYYNLNKEIFLFKFIYTKNVQMCEYYRVFQIVGYSTHHDM